MKTVCYKTLKQNLFECFYFSIYDVLDADVISSQQFRNRLLRENNYKDENDVKELFEAYYWD